MKIGDHLGPYEITAAIGAGGMGEVYRASDTKLKREVAIKVLPSAFTEDEERLARFEREAQLLAQLHHPNIASIFGLEESGDAPALVMELVEGPTLAERLREGPLSVEEALPIARQIAVALEYAHEHGIIHRDLKPANIKLTSLTGEDQVKVLDFGLAKALDPSAPSSSYDLSHSPTITYQATAPGVILGTAAYMSPEQAAGKAVDKRADIWAFGVVVREVLTGNRLFESDSVPETLAGVLKGEIDLDRLPDDVPSAMRRLLRRCLERNPKNRLHDIADARLVIDDSISGHAERPSPDSTTNRPGRGWGWRSAAAGIALGVVVGVAAGYWLGHRSKSQTTYQPPTVRSLTYSGSSWAPSISPDGRTLAFASDRDGTTRIWLQQLATGEEAALTKTGQDPQISPDSASLLFDDNGGIFRVPLIGGTPRKIAQGAQAIWSPDGKRIAYVSRSDEGLELFEASAEGGQQHLLVKNPGFQGRLAWSPDGSRLAYVRHGASVNTNATTSLAILDLASGKRRNLPRLPAGSRVGGLAWDGNDALLYAWSPSAAGGRGALLRRVSLADDATEALFAFSSTPDGIELAGKVALVYGVDDQRQNLFAVAGSNARGKALTRGPTIDRQPAFSPDGRRVVFTSDRAGHFDIWSIELATGALRRLTFDDADDWDPQYTPDGKHLLWSSNRSGNYEIWISDPDGSGARQLTKDGVDAENPTMSADGKWVVYSSGNPAGPGIWKIRTDGSDNQLLLGGSYTLPELAPKTGWVAAASSGSARADGTFGVRVVRLDNGAPVASVTIPGTAPNTGRSRWMPDGRTLISWSGQAGRTSLYRVTVKPGAHLGGPDLTPFLTGGRGEAFESFGVSPVEGHIVISSFSSERDIRMAEGIRGIGESLSGAPK